MPAIDRSLVFLRCIAQRLPCSPRSCTAKITIFNTEFLVFDTTFPAFNHFYIIFISFIYHLYIICTSFVHHFTSLLYHLYIICISFIYHFYIICTSFVHHLYIICTSFYITFISFLYHLYIICTSFYITFTHFDILKRCVAKVHHAKDSIHRVKQEQQH